MGDSYQQGLQQGLQRLGGPRTERQQRETASSASNARPAALPRAPPRNIAPSLEQPVGTDYGIGAVVYPNTTRGTLTDWRAVHQSMPPMKDTLPAFVQTLAPQSDPRPPARSPTGGGSRAKGLSLSDILNAEPVRENFPPARVSSPMREAFPSQLAGNLSGEVSEGNVLQPQPRSSQNRIDVSSKSAIWSKDETQVLDDVMYGHQRGDNHVYQRASKKLGDARSPETSWKKSRELTAQKHGGEKDGKTHVKIAARPAMQYTFEPTFLKQYDGLLVSGWDVIDANKLHVLKYLDRRIMAKTLVLELGRKYSETSIRDQLLSLRDNGLLTRKPASRPWTGADKALSKERRERGASEEELMRACIRTRDDIQETSEDWGVEDTAMSSQGHGKRKADDRKKGNDESKRRQRG